MSGVYLLCNEPPPPQNRTWWRDEKLLLVTILLRIQLEPVSSASNDLATEYL
jgi:hypothetical protein